MLTKQICVVLLIAGIQIINARNVPESAGTFPEEVVARPQAHQVRSLPSYARVSRNVDSPKKVEGGTQVQVAEERMETGKGKGGGISGIGFEGNGIDLTVGPALRYTKYYYNPFAYGGPYSPPVFVPIFGALPNLEGPGLF